MTMKKINIPRKVRRAMAMLLSLVIIVALIPIIAPETASAAPPPGGNWIDVADTGWYSFDTEALEYEIGTAEQLAGLAQLVNGGVTFLNRTVKLIENIYLFEMPNWVPIGTGLGTGTAQQRFSGTFDGNGKVIYDLTITGNVSNYIGLFGFIDRHAIVKNVRMVDVFINVNYTTSPTNNYPYSVGGIVGCNDGGAILNSAVISATPLAEPVTAIVSALRGRGSGGVCGYNNGTIRESYNEVAVYGSLGIGNSGAGGICGENGPLGKIEDCYNKGTINASIKHVGGIVGYNDEYGLIDRVYNVGNITMANDTSATFGRGGIVGYNDGNANLAAYWNNDILQHEGGNPAQRNGYGRGNGNMSGIVELTDTQMRHTTNYPDNYEWFYFSGAEDTWMPPNAAVNDGYPVLRRNHEPVGILVPAPIRTASILVPPPASGQTPLYVWTNIEKNYQVTGIEWSPVDWNPATPTYQDSHIYTVKVFLRANKWFEFTNLDFSIATINGHSKDDIINPVIVDAFTDGANTVVLSYEFPDLTNRITVITHPQSKDFYLGEITGSLTVEASDSNINQDLSFQWFQNSENRYEDGWDITDVITGSRTNSLPIPTTLAPGKYYYYCVVTANIADPAYSNIATVTVHSVPASALLLNPLIWEFASAPYGYDVQPAKTVTVTNTGVTDTPGTISLVPSGLFELSDSIYYGLDTGQYTDFDVWPVTGLSVGIHEANINVPGATAPLVVSFEVLPVTEYIPDAKIDYVGERLVNLHYNEDDGVGELYLMNPPGSPATVTSLDELITYPENSRGYINIPDSWMTGVEREFIKDGTPPNILSSAPQIIVISERPSAPSVVGVPPDRIGGAYGSIEALEPGMEFRAVNSGIEVLIGGINGTPTEADSWIKYTGGAVLFPVLENYEVRYSAVVDEKFASKIVSVYIPDWTGMLEDTPETWINFENEWLYNLEPNAEYTINGIPYMTNNIGEIRTIRPEWFGSPEPPPAGTPTIIKIIKLGEDDGTTTGDSLPHELPIPARPPAPEAYDEATAPTGLLGVPDPEIDGQRGSIAYLSDALGYQMEFQAVSSGVLVIIDDGTTETPIPANNWIPYDSANDYWFPPGSYRVRYIADPGILGNNDGKFASESLVVVIPEQHGTREFPPEAEIDYEKETLKELDPLHVLGYTINGSAAVFNTDGEVPILAGWFGTTISIIKLGNGLTTLASLPQPLPIPARPVAAGLEGVAPVTKHDDGKITGTNDTMEYQPIGDDPVTDPWIRINSPEIDLEPGIYRVRIFASNTDKRFASEIVLIEVPEWTAPPRETPAIAIDYIGEKLTGFVSEGPTDRHDEGLGDLAENTYEIRDADGVVLATISATWYDTSGKAAIDVNDVVALDDSGFKGQWVYIVLLGDYDDFEDSDPFPLFIKPRQAAPGALISGVPPTQGINDARITGTTVAMEWSVLGANDWKDCSDGNTYVYIHGDYEVRYKAVEEKLPGQEGEFRSESTEVDIPEQAGPPPVELTFTAKQIGGFSGTADSTHIEITFDQSVTGLGLSASNITITNGTGEVVKGTTLAEVAGSFGAVYRIPLTEVKTEGTVYVRISNFGTFDAVTGNPTNPVGVPVYKNTVTSKRVTVGNQSGTIRAGTAGSATYSVATVGIERELPITFENINGVPGISMTSANSGVTSITIRTTAATPQGTHPLRITIDGVASNVFYLAIQPSQTTPPNQVSYTVTVSGSYASNNGAGSYFPGEAVTIRAGSSGTQSFGGWSSANSLSFEDPNSPMTTFIMPERNVSVTANWTAVNLTSVSFTATQVGGVSGATSSTGIQLTFSQQVTGLTAGHITITNGTGSATGGTLSGSGNSYTLNLSNVSTQGTVNISIANFDVFSVASNPQQVQVYRDPSARRITVGAQNGTLSNGSSGYATFNVTTENVAYNSAIWLNNINAVTGIYLETTSTTGNYTTVSIGISSSTPQGSHPLRLSIDGMTSDIFYLVVGSYYSTSTYTVTINGSYEYRTGAGQYEPGQVVTIQAGNQGSYGFSGWTTSTSGVSFADSNSPTTTFTMPSRNVTVNANWTASSQNVTFTATQVGGTSGSRNSTGIRLTFNQSVTGLSAGHINISDASGATVKGTLTGSGSTYTLNLTNVSAQGYVDVTIENFGRYTVTNNSQQVQVYWDYVTRRITVGSQNGIPESGTGGQATYNVTTENISSGSSIRLVNLDALAGIRLETSTTTGNSTNVRIGIISSTPEGTYPLQLIINGVASDIFYLTVGYNYSGSYNTYNVTVNGSYASWTGAGRYAPGQVVTIQAGSRSNYTFDRWTYSSGISIGNAYNNTTTFTMPAYNVTITANWIATGSTGSGTSSGSSSWASSMVDLAISTGLVPRSLQSNYTQAITRAEFSALVVTLYEIIKGTEITGRVKFSDTNDTYVEKAAAIGIVNGVGNNRFDPNSRLTREEAAVMIGRLAKELGWTLPQRSMRFSDQSQISSWAVEAVGQVYAAGIMSGVGENTFAPKSQITREQSIVAILRLYDGRW